MLGWRPWRRPPPERELFDRIDRSFVARVREFDELKNYALRRGVRVEKSILVDADDILEQARKILLDVPARVAPAQETALARRALARRIDEIYAELAPLAPGWADAFVSGEGTSNQPATGSAEPQFWTALILYAFLAIFLAILAFATKKQDNDVLWYSVLAAALGGLGASVHLLINLNKVRTGRALTMADVFTGYTRGLLGPLVGWVFYFVFAQQQFEAATNATSPADVTVKLFLMLPFLAGFSTDFVVGIINRALLAVEVALGISQTQTQAGDAATRPAGGPGGPTPGP